MLHENVRLRIAIVGTPINVKVEPHIYNPGSLMLKAPHPDSIDAFCELLKLEHGEVSEGPNYFRTEISRAEFMANIQGAMVMVLDIAKKAKPAPEPSLDIDTEDEQVLAKLQPLKKCPECGAQGGVHWAYCPNHQVLAPATGDVDTDDDLGDL